MILKNRKFVAVVGAIAMVAVAGCQTTGQSAGIGALAGAAGGYLLTGKWEGAAAGAAAGALAGAIIHDVQKRARQVKTASETRDSYDQWEPEQGFRLELEESEVSPRSAQPGEPMTAKMKYAALGVPDEGVDVDERYLLVTPEDEQIPLSQETVKRKEGTWDVDLEFQVAEKAKPGSYELYQVVAAEGQRTQTIEDFAVTEKAAMLTFTIEPEHP